MDAIILAAGLGTRLRPHTLTTPKPLLPVQGRPILDWALGALPPVVTRVLVVVNYLAEQIEAYLASQKHLARWEAVRQQEPRGTGDALRSCRERIESDRFLVANGDDLYGAADLAALAACPAGVLVHPVDEPRNRISRGATRPIPVPTSSRAPSSAPNCASRPATSMRSPITSRRWLSWEQYTWSRPTSGCPSAPSKPGRPRRRWTSHH